MPSGTNHNLSPEGLLRTNKKQSSMYKIYTWTMRRLRTLTLIALLAQTPENKTTICEVNGPGNRHLLLQIRSCLEISETYQIKSRQCEQKVGCRRKVAMNLWPLTWCTLRRIAPRLRLKPWRSLNSRGLAPW